LAWAAHWLTIIARKTKKMTMCQRCGGNFRGWSLNCDYFQFDLGVPFVLEPQDESPFMKFGYVYPGQTMPALYSNLVRAPLFRHKPYPTDFLVVRYSDASSSIDSCNSCSILHLTEVPSKGRLSIIYERSRTSS
jgi:hypothetical protein